MNQQNRQMRRMAQKQGADQPKRPERKQPAPTHTSERTSPGQFFMEVRGELRKVAWPTRPEVINSTIIVLIAVVVHDHADLRRRLRVRQGRPLPLRLSR